MVRRLHVLVYAICLASCGGGPKSASNTSAATGPNEAAVCAAEGLSEAECGAYRAQREDVDEGTGELRAPPDMYVNESYSVELTIGLPTDGARPFLSGQSRSNSISSSGRVFIDDYVKVELTGANFDIDPQGPIREHLGETRNKTFQWRVTPTGPNADRLVATVVPFAKIGEREVPFEGTERALPIQVEVTWGQWITTPIGLIAAAALLAGVLIPIVWAGRRRRLRNGTGASDGGRPIG